MTNILQEPHHSFIPSSFPDTGPEDLLATGGLQVFNAPAKKCNFLSLTASTLLKYKQSGGIVLTMIIDIIFKCSGEMNRP